MRIFQCKFMGRIAQILLLALSFLFVATSSSLAQVNVEVSAQQMDGFGRIVLKFANRFDLPTYELNTNNGVLSLEFANVVQVVLPDISGSLPQFISISRVDPDQKGIRFGLKSEVNVNRLEAGGLLFLDFLPLNWQGLPPGLPEEVISELAQRSQKAAELAELERRIEFARVHNPEVRVNVGRHPTFIRLVFDWTEDTRVDFAVEDGSARLEFHWPVELDLYALLSDLPPEIISVSTRKMAGSNVVEFELSEGVVSRFFKNNDRQYVLDIDLIEPDTATISPEELLTAVEVERLARDMELATLTLEQVELSDGPMSVPVTDQVELTPQISKIGSTIRIAFPFAQETPAAVFKRGDYLWLVLDSTTIINAPDDGELLATVSDDFAVISAGDTQIVRIKMKDNRLASLGSQGPSWVLSLGDNLMAPTKPIKLARRQDDEGRFEIFADMDRPVRLHQLRDPEIGDVLEVVTVFPPAHGIVRRLSFVDFDALASVHGLVIKPAYEGLKIELSPREVVLKSATGLIVSSITDVRAGESASELVDRQGFIDFAALVEKNPVHLRGRREELMAKAADGVGRDKENARLDLAHILIANQLGIEAIGVLDLILLENNVPDMRTAALTAQAVANVIAHRPMDALELLKHGQMSEALDNLMWRAIARVQKGDYVGARIDVLASEVVVGSYPEWAQKQFLLGGIRAAIETDDPDMARRLMNDLEPMILSVQQRSEHNLLEARLDELRQSYDEALDTYGLVIAADIRPTRAEAIYRTILLLDKMGRLEATKAIHTLSRETIVWRGGVLEAQMLQLLANYQFDNEMYRDGFATVREAAETKIDSEAILALTEKAQDVFTDLYINGVADSMEHVDALTLYYDFRYLTPAGARGDEMIRNLARRLIRVDLLKQAASLLEYQIDVRLEGAARSQIAADLAIIYIADRQPDLALLALNKTALANLPQSLDRQRRLLEGRALIDEGRNELALDVIAQLNGRDVDLLRVDAHWSGRRYTKAAEQIELIYSQRNPNSSLSQPARMNLIKAAVGYVLAGDRLGISRIRAKFSEQMSNSPEWPMFDFVTDDAVQGTADFSEITSQIASIDSLSAFLNAYRMTYSADGALAPSLSDV